MDEQAAKAVFEAFRSGQLPKVEWTHEAHLAVCWESLRSAGTSEVLPFLRRAICAYNDVVGTPNTTSSGYHETLTCYFVMAVAQHAPAGLAGVLSAPACRREAPLDHWSRPLLFSTTARAQWVEPDLAGLPWPHRDQLDLAAQRSL